MSSRIPAHSTLRAALRRTIAARSLTALLALLAMTACADDGPSAPDEPEIPTPVLTSVSPSTMVEGASVTLHGSDFGTTPSANLVRIDGVTATVTAATANQLTVTVPVFDCRPHRTVEVQVSRSGNASNSLTPQVRPAAFVDVALGEMLLIDDPSDFCLQFAPASAEAGEYLVGVGSAAERPDVLFDVSLTGATGVHTFAPFPVANTANTVISQVRTDERPAPMPTTTSLTSPLSNVGGWGWHTRVQQRMHRLAQEGLDRARGTPTNRSGAFAGRPPLTDAAPPAVGDQIEIKVPTFSGTTFEAVCTPIPITTEVRVVGERGIFVTDVTNPSTNALTDAEIQAFSDAFDSYIYDVVTEHFGTPHDRDGNERTLIVVTVEFNKALGGLGAVVTWLDFLDPSVCPASDVGELAYFGVPDPDNGFAGSDYLDWFLRALPHEFTHVIQHSVRWGGDSEPDADAVALTAWELEGQAVLAKEIVGHVAQGLIPGQDYGAGIAWSESAGRWYSMLHGLAEYYGYEEGARRADAPETCSLFFFPSPTDPDTWDSTGCVPGHGYGASWSFFRYLTDRYGPDWPGGEAGFNRDWISRNPTLQGTDNVEALLGRPFEQLFAEWAAMHYLDAHVPDADPELLMSSWDLGDVMAGLDANATLEPRARTFTTFAASFSVRGGSTAYSLFDGALVRPATALRVRNADDGVLSGDMRPVLWVVRTR